MSSETEATVLAVLRRHDIGAFNGTQVACDHCRLWMETDDYHQHLAEIVARSLDPHPDRAKRADQHDAEEGEQA